MLRFVLCAALIAGATAVPALAQTPSPPATYHHTAMVHKAKPMTFSNPSGPSNPHTMSGQGCISGPTANRAQNTINPITGKSQAAPIVAIPLNKGAGSVAGATTRAQQAAACAHGR